MYKEHLETLNIPGHKGNLRKLPQNTNYTSINCSDYNIITLKIDNEVLTICHILGN